MSTISLALHCNPLTPQTQEKKSSSHSSSWRLPSLDYRELKQQDSIKPRESLQRNNNPMGKHIHCSSPQEPRLQTTDPEHGATTKRTIPGQVPHLQGSGSWVEREKVVGKENED